MRNRKLWNAITAALCVQCVIHVGVEAQGQVFEESMDVYSESMIHEEISEVQTGVMITEEQASVIISEDELMDVGEEIFYSQEGVVDAGDELKDGMEDTICMEEDLEHKGEESIGIETDSGYAVEEIDYGEENNAETEDIFVGEKGMEEAELNSMLDMETDAFLEQELGSEQDTIWEGSDKDMQDFITWEKQDEEEETQEEQAQEEQIQKEQTQENFTGGDGAIGQTEKQGDSVNAKEDSENRESIEGTQTENTRPGEKADDRSEIETMDSVNDSSRENISDKEKKTFETRDNSDKQNLGEGIKIELNKNDHRNQIQEVLLGGDQKISENYQLRIRDEKGNVIKELQSHKTQSDYFKYVIPELEKDGRYKISIEQKGKNGLTVIKTYSFTVNRKGSSFTSNIDKIRKNNENPRIRIKNPDDIRIISCMVNGLEANYIWEEDEILIDREHLSKGKNIITLMTKDGAGNISTMKPMEVMI